MPPVARFLFGPILCLCACAPASVAESVRALDGRAIPVEELDDFLLQTMDSLGIPGVSIALINDADVVFHRALGVTDLDHPTDVNDGTIFEAGSLTKPVFAYLTMRLVERGLLALDDPLTRHVSMTELWNGWYSNIAGDERHHGITPRTVLAHTTGLPNWRWENEPEELTLAFAPGSRFSYSGEGYEMLADVIARLKGVDLLGLNDLFLEEVAIPLGMTNASIAPNANLAGRKATGHVEGRVSETDWCCNGREFMASGGLHTEARSYANFLIGIMRGQGLEASTTLELLTKHVDLPATAPARMDDGVTGWSLGFGVRPSPAGVLHSHGGSNIGFRSAFVIQRDRGWGYVLLTNSDRGHELDRRLQALLF